MYFLPSYSLTPDRRHRILYLTESLYYNLGFHANYFFHLSLFLLFRFFRFSFFGFPFSVLLLCFFFFVFPYPVSLPCILRYNPISSRNLQAAFFEPVKIPISLVPPPFTENPNQKPLLSDEGFRESIPIQHQRHLLHSVPGHCLPVTVLLLSWRCLRHIPAAALSPARCPVDQAICRL